MTINPRDAAALSPIFALKPKRRGDHFSSFTSELIDANYAAPC